MPLLKTFRCEEWNSDFLEVFAISGGRINLEIYSGSESLAVILTLEDVKKLRKTLKKHIKSQEEN